MHVGKVMARLNPANVRFDVGAGGIPALTSTDVAGALGMVPAGLGRELLCRVWWPDGAALTARELASVLESAQREEWGTRESKMLDAMLAVATHQGGDSQREAQRMYAAAHARRWPRWVVDVEMGAVSEGYARARAGVLVELASPGLCPACGGRRFVVDPSGVHATCSACRETGRRAVSDAWRAEAMRITRGGYARTWQGVYEWTLRLCTDALDEATHAMRQALS